MPSSILIFDLHLIGDVVVLTPLLKALRVAYPNARVVLVAGPWANDILHGTNLVDEIVTFSAPWVKTGQGWHGLVSCLKLSWLLRKRCWDMGIEVRGDVRQILLLWLSGARRRVGFGFTGGAKLLTDVVFDDGVLAHLGEHHRRICCHLGIWDNMISYIPFLTLTAEEKSTADEIPGYIGFHFGASRPLRKLPELEIIQLLSRFASVEVGLTIFLSPGSEHEFDSVLTQLPLSVRSKLNLWSGSLRDFVVTTSRAVHCYCMDSGPAHIASALSVPTTVFFGPSEFEYVHPLGGKVEIISKSDVKCRPCDQINCKHQTFQFCMQGLASRSIF